MDDEGSYLAHFGIKGQKWGVRRFQNPDGSLTPAGRERYGYETIEKGSTIRRISGIKEKESTNPAGLYGFGTETAEDYKKSAYYLPSVNPVLSPKVKRAKVTQYEFTKDAKLMTGKQSVDAYMKQFGKMTMKEFNNDYPIGELPDYKLVQNLCDKYANKSVHDVYKELNKKSSVGSYNQTEAMRFAHGYLHFTTSSISDRQNKTDRRTNIQKFTDKYRDIGYDVIIDPEDYSGGFTDPYLVINRDSVKPTGSYIIKVKH